MADDILGRAEAECLVDEARLAFTASDALTAWRTNDPADGGPGH
jgi:hypothetical protein